jgi:hypothetical protein
MLAVTLQNDLRRARSFVDSLGTGLCCWILMKLRARCFALQSRATLGGANRTSQRPANGPEAGNWMGYDRRCDPYTSGTSYGDKSTEKYHSKMIYYGDV